MSMDVREALLSFDDLRNFARQWEPKAATILVAYSSRHEHAAVVGALDEAGADLELESGMLRQLSTLLHRHVPVMALAMSYPEADLSTGSIILAVPVDEPEWARVTDRIAEFIDVGVPVDDDMIRDALWLALGSAQVPNGAIRMGLDSIEPTELCEHSDGSGQRMSWSQAREQFAIPLWSQAVERMSRELASRLRRRDENEPLESTETGQGPLIRL